MADRECGTCGAHVREPARRDRDRRHLRNLLLAGRESPPAVTADAAYFEELRAGVRTRGLRTP